MTDNDRDDLARIKEMEKRLNNLPLREQLASVVCARHLANGACWGFDTDTPNGDVKQYMRELKSVEESGEKSGIIPLKLARGYVFDYLDFDDAVRIFRKVVGSDGFNRKAEESAKRRREEAVLNLQKFVQEGKGGTVGFFNTNSSDTITKNGKTFPSFCLNPSNFFGILAQGGYQIRTSTGTVASASDAHKYLEDVMKQLEKSPSSNSVLIEVRKG